MTILARAEVVPGLLVILGVVGIFGISIWLALSSEKKIAANLEAVGQRYGGRATTSFWTGPVLEFTHKGISARVTRYGGSKNSPPYTRIWFDWRPAAGTLRVGPEGFWTGLRKMFGAQDIQMGDASFDQQFLIQGAPDEWVREVLDPEVRQRVRTLHDLGTSFWGGSGVRLEAGPAGVTLFCQRELATSREVVETFVDQAVQILERLRREPQRPQAASPVRSASHAPRPEPKAVQILENGTAVEGHCPVCGGPMESPVRRCGSCRTPHHGDCWQYFGGCAIYGCGARR